MLITYYSLQMLLLTLQAVFLGYVSDYFAIEFPTTPDTRSAFLYAAGVYVVHCHVRASVHVYS